MISKGSCKLSSGDSRKGDFPKKAAVLMATKEGGYPVLINLLLRCPTLLFSSKYSIRVFIIATSHFLQILLKNAKFSRGQSLPMPDLGQCATVE